ncbi:hypothetical protein TNCV_4476301 [Trichonephila clavipes]|nr:hypothetical protein TNCV_4476301 [Trichonephila clavipes]
MVNLPWRDPMFTSSIGVLKRAENPSKTMNPLDDFSTARNAENVALVSECVRKDRRQTLEQIAEVTQFSKALFEGVDLS